MELVKHIVTCHLPRGSKLQWHEDIGGGLPSALPRALAEASLRTTV